MRLNAFGIQRYEEKRGEGAVIEYEMTLNLSYLICQHEMERASFCLLKRVCRSVYFRCSTALVSIKLRQEIGAESGRTGTISFVVYSAEHVDSHITATQANRCHASIQEIHWEKY